MKAEFEEATRITPPPTQAPENKVKCPANCACEVSGAYAVSDSRGEFCDLPFVAY